MYQLTVTVMVSKKFSMQATQALQWLPWIHEEVDHNSPVEHTEVHDGNW